MNVGGAAKTAQMMQEVQINLQLKAQNTVKQEMSAILQMVAAPPAGRGVDFRT